MSQCDPLRPHVDTHCRGGPEQSGWVAVSQLLSLALVACVVEVGLLEWICVCGLAASLLRVSLH